MKNLKEIAIKHASNISSLKELHGNAIQEIQHQLDDSNRTIQSMQQKLVQLTVAVQNIDVKSTSHMQLQANCSNTAIQLVQIEIQNLESNLTKSSTSIKNLEYKIKELNGTDIDQSK